MTKEELATERNEVREILEGFSEELSQSNLDKLSRVFCIINGDEKRIADLEKENAELKEKNLSYKDAVDMQMYTNRANKEIADKQLTKAKEIIKTFLGFAEAFGYSPSMDNFITEAEQFLSEVEK